MLFLFTLNLAGSIFVNLKYPLIAPAARRPPHNLSYSGHDRAFQRDARRPKDKKLNALQRMFFNYFQLPKANDTCAWELVGAMYIALRRT